MYNLILILIFASGTALHIFFLQLNQTLKIADSFAYLQMSYYLKNFSLEGFGTGWFGPLYSLPISILDFFLENDFLSAQIINIVLFVLGGIFLFKIGEKYLNKIYNLMLIILYFCSSTLMHYNINILSENLYIPLFLLLILAIHKLIYENSSSIESLSIEGKNAYNNSVFSYIKNSIYIGLILALMYFTRSESFIYLISILIIIVILFLRGDILLSKLFKIISLIFISFFIFISPYIYYLHSITGEWGLTNKGSSNLRQAEMRGIEKMDDSGFEKAVGELTLDNHYLKGGFAGGLDYNKPEDSIGTINYILENKTLVLNRFTQNQKKLYSQILPKILIGDAYLSYNNESSFFNKNNLIYIILIIPFLLIIFGFFYITFNKRVLLSEKRNFTLIILPLFFIGAFFYTLFFTIERYFIVFLPIALLLMVFGAYEIYKFDNIKKEGLKYIFFLVLFMFIFISGLINYYTFHNFDDEKYSLKKEAGLWIKDNFVNTEWKDSNNLKIMERFPIVTYYSDTKKRYLTPYTNKIKNLLEYARFNKIDILIVDTMDFEEYRINTPEFKENGTELKILLNEERKINGFEVLKVFQIPGEKVILYKIKN